MADCIETLLDKYLPKEGSVKVVPCSVCSRWEGLLGEGRKIARDVKRLNTISHDIYGSWFTQTTEPLFTLDSIPSTRKRLAQLEKKAKSIETQHLRCSRCGIMIGSEHLETLAYQVKGQILCGDCKQRTWEGR